MIYLFKRIFKTKNNHHINEVSETKIDIEKIIILKERGYPDYCISKITGIPQEYISKKFRGYGVKIC